MSDEESSLGEQRREELLRQIQRSSATVGHTLPKSVDIGGTEMNLREFVWETKKQGIVPPEDRDRVRKVRSNLKRERERRKQRLESEDLSPAEAEELVDSIIGIDRAIAALKNLREPDLAEQERERKIEDNRRWTNFLDNILD